MRSCVFSAVWPLNPNPTVADIPGRLRINREIALSWLGNLDSNQDKQSQSLLCYRYTIPQRFPNKFSQLANYPEVAAKRANSLAAIVLLPATSRTWQARFRPRVSHSSDRGAFEIP